MKWKIFALENDDDGWVVQAVFTDGDQKIYTATFHGIGAEARAYEYFRWITGRTSAVAA